MMNENDFNKLIENKTDYEIILMILRTNLKLMELGSKSTPEEKEILSYHVISGLNEYSSQMLKTFKKYVS